MEILQKVQNYLKNHNLVKPAELVLAAVSGGPDSVVMLHILRHLAQEGGFTLHVAHLNHMFRGDEAAGDADFVRALAEEYGLPVTVEAIDVPAYNATAGLSAQAAAREVRYGFLQKVARQIGASKIALAHHADDQAETILINFLRGAGTGGLRGITPVRDDLFIRPLLTVRRAAIEAYCRKLELPFRTDSSNAKPVYYRNRVRLKLLPLLRREYNPGVVEAMLRQAEICRAEDDYLRERAAAYYASIKITLPDGGIGLSRSGLDQAPTAIQRRVLRLLWQDLTGAERDLNFTHVENLAALPGLGVGARAALPGGVTAVASYNSLDFYRAIKQRNVAFYQHPVQIPGVTPIPATGQVLRVTRLTAEEAPAPASLPPDQALLDLAQLPAQLYVRRRLPGDIFQPYGQSAPTKLKKFLINQKIPREKRDDLPLLCTAEEIIWVAGVRPSDKWKITNTTTQILHLQLD